MLSQDNKPDKSDENLRNNTEIISTIGKSENKKISPFYTAYSELKEKYSDCVIAYRLGDFYEILGKDAVTIATELDLTLTCRDCGLPYRIPMIGFPYHAADNYVAKIIDRGHKIAVVEESDDINIFPQKGRHTMPDKNKTNLAKTPLFSRFLSNSRLKYVWYVCARLYQKSSKISTFWLLASLTADFQDKTRRANGLIPDV